MSTNTNQTTKNIYDKNLKNVTFSNYDYMASNISTLDSNYSCVNCNYTIEPNIKITYSVPYNTGSCVKKTEKEAIPFNIQSTELKFFSNLVNS